MLSRKTRKIASDNTTLFVLLEALLLAIRLLRIRLLSALFKALVEVVGRHRTAMRGVEAAYSIPPAAFTILKPGVMDSQEAQKHDLCRSEVKPLP